KFQARIIKTTLILLVSLSLTGCNIERDREDARVVASRVHAQMQSGDYAAIYRESAPRFKNVGTESQFISLMQQYHQGMGTLKKVDEVAYQTRIDTEIGR